MESKIYNPAGQPKEWLIEHFVVRTNVFEKLFKDLQSGKMQYPEQHYLIQGQRGMGKTTLLLRLKYEIEKTPKLNAWLVPVFFNEESYDLTTLSNLWEKLLKYLDNLWQTGGEYYKRTDEFVGTADYEKSCYALLVSILNKEKKKLVIFFDNFGQLFLDNLSDKEQHRFREILMNCNDIRIIGASAVVLHDLHDYSKPFFEFFRIITLEGLNKDETFQLITKLQDKSEKKINLEKNKAKIETLAILTGGVIRTIMLLYEVILTDEDGTALRDLDNILDRITPLFKHRIEDLPAQQRKIIDVIAKKWDAVSTKEIAENIRENGQPMPTKLISAQLQQLEKNNVIEKKQTNTKNHLYQLKERFFNIWYLMRNGDRMDKCRVVWLTRFLESWYDDEASIGDFIKRHVKLLRSGKYDPLSALKLAEAWTNSSKIDLKNQALLIKETAEILNEDQKKSLPRVSLEKLIEAVKLLREKKAQEALALLQSVDQKSDKVNQLIVLCYLDLNHPQKALDILNLIPSSSSEIFKPYLSGWCYLILGSPNKAYKLFEHAFEKEINKKRKGVIAGAIGSLYKSIANDNENALKYYSLALQHDNKNVYSDIIDVYTINEDYENLEKYLLKAINSGKIEFEKDLIELYLFRYKDYKKAANQITKGLKTKIADGDFLFYKACLSYFHFHDNGFEKLFLDAKKELLQSGNSMGANYKRVIIILSFLYIDIKSKDKALKIVNELDHTNGIEHLLKSIIYIWANNATDAFKIIKKYLTTASRQELEFNNNLLELLILLLLTKKQYHFTLTLFEKEDLNFKDRFKPIYYALMHHMKDEYPNEYLKMGDELKQPVADVLKRIEEMAVEYA
ncbi:hypothetical protein KXQ82_18540 [Mucilaginibacter sp. HMF5004]|uniref:winged-helix domain-containing protein n=1 Tax=Mucilaginibacter rivuli TaxID=2857527 RepID=UPI001C605B2E|nr:winged-helix domain-containing protein [Mucilaginibacter rivuli]MBW4891730.1 hypothetical protein [Mucilaginibacter rivuli]